MRTMHCCTSVTYRGGRATCHHWAVLRRVDEWVTAAEIYDGDVVAHPLTDKAVTIAAMMQLRPLKMIYLGGVIEFDPRDNTTGDELFAEGAGELDLQPDTPVLRLFQYAPQERS